MHTVPGHAVRDGILYVRVIWDDSWRDGADGTSLKCHSETLLAAGQTTCCAVREGDVRWLQHMHPSAPADGCTLTTGHLMMRV